MADRPILFSAPMVRALLTGSKTQTRRVIKPNPWPGDREPPYIAPFVEGARAVWHDSVDSAVHLASPFAVGDRLWVREAWKVTASHDKTKPSDLTPATPIYFTADDQLWPVARYRAGMHMPRWASRLTLTITDVRVERLQDISEADAIAEGWPVGMVFPVDWYRDLWDSINGAGAWDANPWVVAVSFDVREGNIDA